MRTTFFSKAVVAVLALSTALWAATPAKKKAAPSKSTTAKSTTAKTSKTTQSSKTTAVKSTAGKKSTTAKGKSSKQTASTSYRRSNQREPSPERYQEIQRSLSEKGYFGGSVNGNWGPDSVDALKRFQRDQNIGDDGKLGSLSLIALGLGPKRGTSEPASTPEK